MYTYDDKQFKSKKMLFSHLREQEVISCSHGYFLKAFSKNNLNIKQTLEYIDSTYTLNRSIRNTDFTVNDVYFKNMREFEIHYSLPANTLSSMKNKRKISTKEAAKIILESPEVQKQTVYKNSHTARFLQLKLPTTNFAYR
ncbi:hypothetical protein [Cysteiniphilum halobium]|uniref:hypothetical protein n=1 Tax=Cysteiniphilum halobium TaxID=2219059 RepID=UPI003F84F402